MADWVNPMLIDGQTLASFEVSGSFACLNFSLRSYDFFTSERNLVFISFNKSVSFQKQF